MKIAVTEVMTVPDGSTHYLGWLLEENEHTFLKQKEVAGFPVWFYWHPDRREWVLHGDHPPANMKPLNDPPHSKVIE